MIKIYIKYIYLFFSLFFLCMFDPKVTGHLDYKQQLDTVMKAVGIRTRDEVKQSSSSLSSMAASPTGTPAGMSQSTSMSEVSSSDEEAGTDVAAKASGRDTVPVILEDYSPSVEVSRSKSGSLLVGEESGIKGDAIPESVSFDSGVVINRTESESGDLLSDQPSPCLEGVPGKPSRSLAASLARDQRTVEDSELKSTNSLNVLKATSELLTRPGDRIGDAAANGGKDNDIEDVTLRLSEGSPVETDTLDKEGDSVVSNLQRKQLFDSMYRLVLDDDLLDVMNEEDDDTVN